MSSFMTSPLKHSIMSAENSLRIQENLHVMKPPVNESEWCSNAFIWLNRNYHPAWPWTLICCCRSHWLLWKNIIWTWWFRSGKPSSLTLFWKFFYPIPFHYNRTDQWIKKWSPTGRFNACLIPRALRSDFLPFLISRELVVCWKFPNFERQSYYAMEKNGYCNISSNLNLFWDCGAVETSKGEN